MRTRALATVDNYLRALRAVMRERVPRNYVAMLREHFNAPDHTTTWWHLARKVRYRNFKRGTKDHRRAGWRAGLRSEPPRSHESKKRVMIRTSNVKRSAILEGSRRPGAQTGRRGDAVPVIVYACKRSPAASEIPTPFLKGTNRQFVHR